MRKGIALPILLIVLFFVVVPLFFLALNLSNILVKQDPTVLSSSFVSTSNMVKDKVTVKVVSNNPGWDLMVYSCQTQNQCVSSLTGGEFVSRSQGGSSSVFSVLDPSRANPSTKFVKLFVRVNASQTQSKGFAVNSDAKQIVDGVEVVILPVPFQEASTIDFIEK